ncbi:MAG: type 4a pilus biogenesis protein PilO [Gemmatimonadota bacterium]|nr:type 4a pilus biogenesis protein PilO [Gemmatimonadota bacterium]
MAWYNPTDPTQRNWMVAGVVALLLIVPFRMYVLSPRQVENDELRERVESLETQNRQASVLAAQGGGDLEERMALYERHVSRLEELIPAAEEVAILADDIANRARTRGVELQRMVPEPREPGTYYDRTSYSMAVVGEYHSVGRFLTDIASLSRIVTPIELDIQPFTQANLFPNMEAPVLATFRIETYVLPDPANRDAESEAGSES